MAELTAERVRELFNYNPDTGVFTRRVPTGRHGCWKAGSIAGSPRKKGYSKIAVDGKEYLVHRLAWLWMTGFWPEGDLDHKDGNSRNDAFENLRPATVAQNMANAKLRCDNKLGIKGVTYNSRYARPYLAWMNGKYLGCFSTAEAAKAVRTSSAKKYYGEFAREG